MYVDELELVEKITRQPTKYLPLCDQSAVDVQKLIIDNDNADDDNKIQRVKSKVHIRITGAPWKINDDTEGQLVSITGITVRISQPTMLTKVKRFLCKKCANITTIKVS